MALKFSAELVEAIDFFSDTLVFQAKLTETEFDAALVQMEYGEQPDLSDGTTLVDTNDRALFKPASSVSDESFISNYDEWVDLNNYNLARHTMTVETPDKSTQFDRGSTADYKIDFYNGKIKVLSDGTMADNTEYHISYDYDIAQFEVSGLTEGNEYYYRGHFRAINYESAGMMDSAVASEGFMDDLMNNSVEIVSAVSGGPITDNETAMNSITDSETAMNSITDVQVAMDIITDKVMPMNKVAENYWIDPNNLSTWLKSPHIVNTMWSKQMASEKFWDLKTVITNQGTLSYGISPAGGNYMEIYAEYNGDNHENVEINLFTVNFDEINSLKFELEISEYADRPLDLLIGDDVKLTKNSNQNWTTEIIDTTTLSGELDVFVRSTKLSGGHIDDKIRIKIYGFRLE